MVSFFSERRKWLAVKIIVLVLNTDPVLSRRKFQFLDVIWLELYKETSKVAAFALKWSTLRRKTLNCKTKKYEMIDHWNSNFLLEQTISIRQSCFSLRPQNFIATQMLASSYFNDFLFLFITNKSKTGPDVKTNYFWLW